MSQDHEHEFISVDTSSLEEGDLLPGSVLISSAGDPLSEREVALCDGEGGSAPSVGTRHFA